MNRSPNRTALRLGLLALCCGAGMAHGQLILNEIMENPANGGDQTWEYIEIVGPPGYNLSGYAVALVKGGQDLEPPFDVPDGSTFQRGPEIDEAFSLDGWSVGPDGIFVIYNQESFGFTGLAPYLMPNPDFVFFEPEGPDNKRYLNGAGMPLLYIPSFDTGGNLSNDDSSTYLLIRKRPGHSLDANGQSVYGPEYGWKKDATPDVDFNSRLDFGDEDTLGVPIYLGDGLDGNQTGPLMMEPVQIIDEIAWSNNSGKEYSIPGRGILANEISETPKFNPDVVTRVRYGHAHAGQGSRINNSGELEPTTLADENWIYGELLNVDPGTPDYVFYKPLFEPGKDLIIGTLDDELNYLAPTDPNGASYSYDGPGDDNPLEAPFLQYSPALDTSGTLLFAPYDISGFAITPAALNDAPAGSALASTPLATQERIINGDLNFDGTVDLLDLIFAQSHEGKGLDDRSDAINDRNTDDTSDDSLYSAWTYQVESFNGLLMLVRMDLTDGTTGEWNSGDSATASDVAVIASMVPNCTRADLAAPYGQLNFFDVSAFLGHYNNQDPRADMDNNGSFNFFDISAFLNTYQQGCP